jgi:flagellar M-ring protein FliF
MKTQITDTAKKLWNDFRGFPLGQQIVVGVALAALVIGGLFYTMWKPATTYAPLYTNLAPTDASAIIDKLNASGTAYQLAAAGTEIDVPKDKVYSARLAVSAAGLPSSGQTGYALLDKEGVTTSDFKQQVDYQRAVEGELAKTIQSLQGVTAARVQLAIPQQTVFNDNSSKPTASVLLTVSPGATLTSQQVQSVVYLVSSAVPSMDPSGVSVADSAGNVLSAPGSGVTDAAATSTQVQATQAKNAEIQTQLQAMLDKALGPNHATVTVNATLNFDKTQTETTTPTYNKNAPPISEQTKTETYSNGAGGASGTLGTTNGTANGSTTPSGTGNYKSTETTKDNSVGKQTTSVQVAPGGVKQLSIAVMLDSNVKGVNTAAITNLMKTGSGYVATRGDQISVQAVPFDTTSAKAEAQAAAAALALQKAQQAHDDLMSLIRQGSIVGVVLLVLLVAWLSNRKRAKAAKAAAEEDDDEDDLDDEDDFILPSAPVHRPVPVEDASVIAEMQEAAARRKAFISLAEEQPDDVARVLSGWLN